MLTARPPAVLVVLALLGALPALGCGYTLVRYPVRGSESQLSVAVQTFENHSFEPGYEFVLADAIRREFARRGALRLVDDPARADVVLAGSITDVGTARRSFSSVVLTLENEVGVNLDVEVQRPGSEIAIDPRVLRENEIYLASADIEAERKNREEALRRVATELAVRIHDVVYEVAPP